MKTIMKFILILMFLPFTSCVTSKQNNPVVLDAWKYDDITRLDLSVQLFHLGYSITNTSELILREVSVDEFLQMANNQANKSGANLMFTKVNAISNLSRVITAKIKFEGIESRRSGLRMSWMLLSGVSFFLIPYYEDVTVRVTYELKDEVTKKSLKFQEDFMGTEYVALYPIPVSSYHYFFLLGSYAYVVHYPAVASRLSQLVEKF